MSDVSALFWCISNLYPVQSILRVSDICIYRSRRSATFDYYKFPQLPLFPIVCESLEANPGDFFALRREHVLQEIFLERFLLVKLTLMKGDKHINIFETGSYCLLFSGIRKHKL